MYVESKFGELKFWFKRKFCSANKNLSDAQLLHLAAACDASKSIVNMIKNGFDLNSVDENGDTALHISLKKKAFNAAIILSSNTKNLNIQNNEGETALHLAVNFFQKQYSLGEYITLRTVFSNICRPGVDVNILDKNGKSPFCYVVQNDLTDIAERVCCQGAKVNDSYQGMPFLAMALKHETNKMLLILLSNGGNVNLIDDSGKSLLHHAVETRRLKAVNWLIDEKVDLDIQDKEGNTALICAIKEGESAIARELIFKKADVNLKNKQGATALMWAAFGGNIAVMTRLIENNADLDMVASFGTALMCAIEANQTEAAYLLLDAGADLFLKNSKGKDAFNLAMEKEQFNIVKKIKTLAKGQMKRQIIQQKTAVKKVEKQLEKE